MIIIPKTDEIYAVATTIKVNGSEEKHLASVGDATWSSVNNVQVTLISIILDKGCLVYEYSDGEKMIVGYDPLKHDIFTRKKVEPNKENNDKK